MTTQYRVTQPCGCRWGVRTVGTLPERVGLKELYRWCGECTKRTPVDLPLERRAPYGQPEEERVWERDHRRAQEAERKRMKTDTENDVAFGYIRKSTFEEVDALEAWEVRRLAVMAVTFFDSKWSDRWRDLERGVSSVLQ